MPRAIPSHRRFSRRLLAVALLSLVLVSCWEVEPDLQVSTVELDFADIKEVRSFTVLNDSQDNSLTSGVTTLEYKIKTDKPWISVTPASGSCGGMEKVAHTATVDRSLMEYGRNTALISITSNGGSATIAVVATRPVPGCSDAPTAPASPSPAKSATGVATDVSLSWDGGVSQCDPLTATYDVYFGTTTPPPFHHDNDSLKVWNPGPLANNTIYYWRVVAKDANGATSGPEWTFRTVCVLPPTAVALSTPANNATGVSILSDLAWTGGNSQCGGMSRTYDVYFGATSPPPFVNNTSIKSWDPGTLAKGATYYWKVVAKDANGSVSSPEWSFTTEQAVCTAKASAVSLVSPTNSATNVPVTQDLTWSGGDSQCAGLTATYDVYFGPTTPPPFHHDNGTSKAWDAPLEYNTVYYWRVVAKDANGSTSSSERTFRTPCNLPPTAPTPTYPADNATAVPVTDNLAWNNGNSQCSGQTATYDVYFGITSPPPLVASSGTTKAWDPGTMLPATKYYWKIVAKDSFGSTTSVERTFTTAVVPCTAGPGVVSLQNPADGASGIALDADLVWAGGSSQCQGVQSTYDVYFGTVSPPPFHHNNGNTMSWDPGTLQALTRYYWRVVAKDDNGSVSSVERDFTTGAAPCTLGPSAVAIVSPSNGATGVPTDADITWNGGSSQCAGLTSTYDVYFGTTNPPPFHHNNASGKSWDPGTLADATTYYWKIVAKDANGTESGAVWNFTTAEPPCTLPPTTAVISAPANTGTNVSVQANLAWSGGTSQCEGLTATYDVYFGTTSPPPFDHNNGTVKSFDPGTLQYSTTYYWRIVSKDANGETPGPVWSFTTAEPCLSPPTAACTPTPSNNRTSVNESTNLAWQCGASQCGLAVTYDVYFSSTDPTLGEGTKLGSTGAKTWDLPKLARNTQYYWKVVTKDANGTVAGPVWTFKTRV